MSEQIEFRHIPLGQLETRLDGSGPGTFEGYANWHMRTDSYGTHFTPGSWKGGGLDEGKYALLDMHDPSKRIGWFYASEDENGLHIRGEYSKTQRGQDARIEAMEGIANELSVGFVRTGVNPENADEITAARLVEVSQITTRMASQPGAELAAVRQAVMHLDERAEDEDEDEEEAPDPDEAEAVELTDDDLTDEELEADEDERVDRPNPGVNALHDYWTKGKGLGKWANKPHPWTALYRQLRKYIKNPNKAKATAAKWYREVKGHWPGEKKGKRGGEIHEDSIAVSDPAHPLTVANPGEAPPVEPEPDDDEQDPARAELEGRTAEIMRKALMLRLQVVK